MKAPMLRFAALPEAPPPLPTAREVAQGAPPPDSQHRTCDPQGLRMAHDRPTPYAELADVITNLGLIVRERRRADGLSMRAAARQINVSFSTISRLESGEHLDGRTLAAVLRWLGTPAPAHSPRKGQQ